MHYKNGREAKIGDKVLYPGDQWNAPRVGILWQVNAQSDTCNGKLAQVIPTDGYVTLKDCIHVDDALPVTPPPSAAP